MKNLKDVPVIVMAPRTLTEHFKQIDGNASPDQQDITETPISRTLHILLAEDNPINTKLAVGFIQLKNWKVDCAINGIDAVARFQEKSYDLILMDIQMPEMDGMEATRKIREIEAISRLKPVPVVALSAHAMKGDIDKALSCGMDDYITKPFKPNELYFLIEKLTRLKT
jgi:CheY-like chemotaxis protein